MSKESTPFLDRGAIFEGKLTFSGTLRIDGQLRGEARSRGRLVVGEPGIVQADIEVGELLVLGTVVGAVRASGAVRVAATGRLEGDVSAAVFSVEDGGFVEARIRMKEEAAADRDRSDPADEAAPGAPAGR